MRILLDLRLLNQGEATGLGRYASSLAARLLDLTSEDYRFIGTSSTGVLRSFADSNVGVDLPEADGDAASRMLALMAYLEHIDLLFSPFFPVPERRTCRAVLMIHDLIPLRRSDWCANDRVVEFFDGALRRSARSADRILTNSECTKTDVVDLYAIDSDRITVVPLAAAPIFDASLAGADDAEVVKHLGIDGPFVLSVATLEPRKNLRRLLDAYDAIRRAGVDVRLAIVGKQAWGAAEVRQAIARSRYRADIVVTGHVRDDHLAALYRRAQAFVYPSLYEGFGLPVLEAMASGAPVVTSRCGALPEVAGDAAEYCEALASESIAEATVRLITDSARRSELSSAGRHRAAAFCWERTAAETRQTFLDCLAGVEPVPAITH
jgi:glycosyltransferase involved in cell wall biosynthesis